MVIKDLAESNGGRLRGTMAAYTSTASDYPGFPTPMTGRDNGRSKLVIRRIEWDSAGWPTARSAISGGPSGRFGNTSPTDPFHGGRSLRRLDNAQRTHFREGGTYRPDLPSRESARSEVVALKNHHSILY